MIKRILLTVLCIMIQISAVHAAATQFKVTALNDFDTARPTRDINVRMTETVMLGDYLLEENAVLHCQLANIIEPKRGKRNASFIVRPVAYTVDERTYSIEDEMYGKHSKKKLSKEELKKIKPTKVLKTAALTVGNYFVKGVSTVYAFGEGVVKNEKDNRLKSGVVNAYEESPLSYINEGEQLRINQGDNFYLVFKLKDKKNKKNDEETEDTEDAENDIEHSENNEEVLEETETLDF